MRVLLAPDAFKDCLSAPEVCRALEQGILSVCKEARVFSAPLADGGEGTASCFAAGCGGKLYPVPVTDAYFKKKTAFLALSPDRQTALVEMAQASGIQGIDKNHLCTRKATTYGTGEMLAAALQLHPKRIIVGLGGSATTDGGMGALSALGVRFLDENGEQLSPIGENMVKVREIRPPEKADFSGVSFQLACDVTNPFFGETGAAAVFAPQKGATPNDVALLDSGLRNLAGLYKKAFGRAVDTLPGAGAAGGLCGGLYAFFGGEIVSGFSVLANACALESKIQTANLVVTGEGRTDAQTAFGKLPVRVCTLAKKHGVPCVLISGDIASDFDAKKAGFSNAIRLKSPEMTTQEAIKKAPELLSAAAQAVMKEGSLWKTGI